MELILDLVAEGTVMASKSPRLPKPVRYFLIGLICVFYIGVFAIFELLGILLLRDNETIAGSIVIIFGIVFLIGSILAFRRAYLKRK